MKSEKEFSDTIVKKIHISMDSYYSGLDSRQINETNDSGVLVIIYFTKPNTPSIIFTKRSMKLRNHAGEVSFPGGRYSSNDASLVETALRETREEIGLQLKREDILGCLPPTNTYTTKILIHPFVVIITKPIYPIIPNEEVDEIIEIPVERLVRSMEIDKEHTLGKQEMYKFLIDGYLIWGATARILKDLLDLLT